MAFSLPTSALLQPSTDWAAVLQEPLVDQVPFHVHPAQLGGPACRKYHFAISPPEVKHFYFKQIAAGPKSTKFGVSKTRVQVQPQTSEL